MGLPLRHYASTPETRLSIATLPDNLVLDHFFETPTEVNVSRIKGWDPSRLLPSRTIGHTGNDRAGESFLLCPVSAVWCALWAAGSK